MRPMHRTHSRIEAANPHQMHGEPQQLVAAEGDIELGLNVIADPQRAR